jgi:hypothetical protein
MERRLGHFFLNNEMFFSHQILTFYTIIFSIMKKFIDINIFNIKKKYFLYRPIKFFKLLS